MTLCDHMINSLCEFVDNRPPLEPATLSGLVAIDLAEVEIYCLLSVMWSIDLVLKVSEDLMDGGPLL